MKKDDKKIKVSKVSPLLINIRNLIETARKSTVRYIDNTMTLTYFLIGSYIVEDEQQGKKRAGYAEATLKFLGEELTKEFGRGFSSRNLASMKKFYITFKTRIDTGKILQTVSAKSCKSI